MKPLAVLCVQIFLLLFSSFAYSMQAKYSSVFSFGDSYSDTGNHVILSGGPATPALWIAKPPYGMTFFGQPSGRASDGRLAIDFIAQALGLPLLPPSLSLVAQQSVRGGVNFAVGGATALERAFFVDNGFKAVSPFNISLGVQLRWFDALKPVLCGGGSPQACHDYFATALFVVGELGCNDYSIMLLDGKSVDEAGSHVLEIVGNICAAMEKLMNDGGKTVVVSGIPPLGCAPMILANQTGAELEPRTGCLKDLNLLSKKHNRELRRALTRLGARHPGVRLIYADLYTPIINFATSPFRYGFNGTDGVLRACCTGGGGSFNLTALCGMPGVSACADPSMYMDWDGVHLTEAANRRIAHGWLGGPYADPPILSTNELR